MSVGKFHFDPAESERAIGRLLDAMFARDGDTASTRLAAPLMALFIRWQTDEVNRGASPADVAVAIEAILSWFCAEYLTGCVTEQSQFPALVELLGRTFHTTLKMIERGPAEVVTPATAGNA